MRSTTPWLIAGIAGAMIANLGCAGRRGQPVGPEDTGRDTLATGGTAIKVAMFPWIPDSNHDQFAALWQHYETDFSLQYPGDSATVEVADGDYYDATDVARWLTTDGYALVEIDLVMLGDVLATDAIVPFRVESIQSRFFPTAIEATQLGGSYYGIPHLMCTYFLFARDPTVTAATTFDALWAAMGGLPAGTQRFAGNLAGSWDSTALYIESWTEQQYGSPAGAISNPVQAKVLDDLQQLASACELPGGGGNPCTDGTYDANYDEPAQRFAAETASTMFGYSERLWVVLTNSPTNASAIAPSALPLGTVSTPLLFTDAFVISKACTGSCFTAAVDFVTYITSTDALGYMLASEDAGAGAVPRYLLPANPSATTYGPLAGDVYYPQFMGALHDTVPQPSTGVPEYKDANAAAINVIIAGG